MIDTQAQTTRFCARVIGPLMLIIAAMIITRFDTVALMITGVLQAPPLAFVTGLFTLIVGLVLFVAHHRWSSITAIVISVFAIATIVRGVILMLAPDIAAGFAEKLVHGSGGGAVWIVGGVSLLIGLWLTYAGWLAKSV